MPDVDDRSVDIGAEQGLKGSLYLFGIGRSEVLERGVGRPVRMRVDKRIEGIGNGNLRMRVSWESEL